MKKSLLLVLTLVLLVLIPNYDSRASSLSSNLKGRILLQVESKGEAWYINPDNEQRYSLGLPNDAFNLMRKLGVGITNDNLKKIKIANENLMGEDSDSDGLSDTIEDSIGTDKNSQDSDGDGYNDQAELINGYNPNGPGKISIDNNFAKKQAGKIFLQVESKGEAWYVNPLNNQRYYLGRPADAFAVMRSLGLGITNDNLAVITVNSDKQTDSNEVSISDSTSGSANVSESSDLNKLFEFAGSYGDKVLTADDYFAVLKKDSALDTLISDYHQNKLSDVIYCQTSNCLMEASSTSTITQEKLKNGIHIKLLAEKIVNPFFVPIVLSSYTETYKTNDGKYAMFSMTETLGVPKSICELKPEEACTAENVLKSFSDNQTQFMSLSVYDSWEAYQRNQTSFSSSDTTVHTKSAQTFDVPDFNNLQCMLTSNGVIISGNSVTMGRYDKTTLDDSYIKSHNFSNMANLYVVKVDDSKIVDTKIENNALLIKALQPGTTTIWLGDKGIPSSDYKLVANGCYLPIEITVTKDSCNPGEGCMFVGYTRDDLLKQGFVMTNW